MPKGCRKRTTNVNQVCKCAPTTNIKLTAIYKSSFISKANSQPESTLASKKCAFICRPSLIYSLLFRTGHSPKKICQITSRKNRAVFLNQVFNIHSTNYHENASDTDCHSP